MNKNVSNVVISRLASLILYSLRNFSKICTDSCGLIIQLLQYVKITGVTEMFTQICDFNSPMTEVQHILVEANFSSCVMNCLNTPTDDETIEQLIRIVRMSSGNPVLMNSFKKPEITDRLKTFVDNKKIRCGRCIHVYTD